MPNMAPRPSSVEVEDLALDLELALVGAVLPAVAVEAVAGADADVDREHGLHGHLEVAEADRALLHDAEEAGAGRAHWRSCSGRPRWSTPPLGQRRTASSSTRRPSSRSWQMNTSAWSSIRKGA